MDSCFYNFNATDTNIGAHGVFKPFSLIFFILVLAWLGSIFITSNPETRMDRTCVPIKYMDKAGTAGMQLFNADWGLPTHEFFEKVNYGCRFIVWRVFYADDWNKAQAQQQELERTQQQTADTGTTPNTPHKHLHRNGDE
jgi:hypothetical protein